MRFTEDMHQQNNNNNNNNNNDNNNSNMKTGLELEPRLLSLNKCLNEILRLQTHFSYNDVCKSIQEIIEASESGNHDQELINALFRENYLGPRGKHESKIGCKLQQLYKRQRGATTILRTIS